MVHCSLISAALVLKIKTKYIINVIKCLSPMVGFKGSDVHNLTIVIDNTNKEIVSDEP